MSTKRIWKCYGCDQTKGVDFIAVDPKCPTCGVDANNPADPERFLIQAVAVIHFIPPASERLFGKKGNGRLACQPDKSVSGYMATGDPRETNCPACKKSPEFLKYRPSEVSAMYAIPDDASDNLETEKAEG